MFNVNGIHRFDFPPMEKILTPIDWIIGLFSIVADRVESRVCIGGKNSTIYS